MPRMTDSTIINYGYDTSGNGARKLVRLDNGWLVAVFANHNIEPVDKRSINLYVSKDKGENWRFVSFYGFTSTSEYTLASSAVSVGNMIYIFYAGLTSLHLARYDFDKGSWTYSSSSGMFGSVTSSSVKNVSLVANKEGTELHAVWEYKSSSSSKINIRYVKGNVDKFGDVRWGSVEDATIETSFSYSMPSITLNSSGIPVVACIHSHANSVIILKRDNSLESDSKLDVKWSYSKYANSSTSSYGNSSPSIVFVPYEINGLTNGRIWLTWHGKDEGTQQKMFNIMSMYSDDGGTTWSNKVILTNNASYDHINPSVTVDRRNRVSVVYTKKTSTSTSSIGLLQNINGNWGSEKRLTATGNVDSNPSTLVDFGIDTTEPLFIYEDVKNAKIKFYGDWISVNVNELSNNSFSKTNKNILTYSITTDGEMSTITEKVNGVVVGEKTANKGEELSVIVADEQWDNLPYGKYYDIEGSTNLLTIEMGLEKWEYPFEKKLGNDANLYEIFKAMKDSNDIYLASLKKRLSSKVGISSSETLEIIIDKFELGKEWATGQLNWSSNSTSVSSYSVSGLTFKPAMIIAYIPNENIGTRFLDGSFYGSNIMSGSTDVRVSGITPSTSSFSIKITGSGYTRSGKMIWYAFS